MILSTAYCPTRHLFLRRPNFFAQAAPCTSRRRGSQQTILPMKFHRFASSSSNASSTSSKQDDKERKTQSSSSSHQQQLWTNASDCLKDHAEVWTRLPTILGAYIGPNQLPAQLSESIMVAVNSKNNCPYCEGLHGELARMAGVEQHEQLQAAESVEECTALVQDPAVAYARIFANVHRGEGTPNALEQAYQAVEDVHGLDKAKSVEALCWFLTWGSLGGNTVNSVLWGGKRGSFPLAFTVYYAPLFGVIAAMNQCLSRMPNMPGVFFQGMGVTLTVAGGTWMTPVGLLGLSQKKMAKP